VTKAAKVWLIVGIVAVVLLCCCIATFGVVAFYGSITSIDVGEAVSAPRLPGVTLANYGRVQNGMTYEEVAAIFGGPGGLAVEMELAGVRAEIYQWNAAAGGYAQITFLKGGVYQKRKFGLK
jgi:hypothetical protein